MKQGLIEPRGPHRAPPLALQQSMKWSTLRQVAVDAAVAWSNHRASSKGAALALYTLFSLAPLLLLVTAIAGLFFSEHTVRLQLLAQVRNLVGEQGASAVETLLMATQERSSNMLAAMLSFAIVLVSATTAFSELKTSLDELWELAPAQGNGVWLMLRERFVSVGLLLVLSLLLLVLLAVSAALGALQSHWIAQSAHLLVSQSALICSEIFSFLGIVVLFAAIYKLLPNTAIAWRDVLPGALFTAVLFMLGKGGIGFYLAHGGVSSAYGAAASFVALILWVYYSAQIFFYGALLTHEWTFTLGSRRDQPRQIAQVSYVERPPTSTLQG